MPRLTLDQIMQSLPQGYANMSPAEQADYTYFDEGLGYNVKPFQQMGVIDATPFQPAQASGKLRQLGFNSIPEYLTYLYGPGGEMVGENFFALPETQNFLNPSYVNTPLLKQEGNDWKFFSEFLGKGLALTGLAAGAAGMFPSLGGGAVDTAINAGGLDMAGGDAGSIMGQIFGAGGSTPTAATAAALAGGAGALPAGVGTAASVAGAALPSVGGRQADPLSLLASGVSGIYGLSQAGKLEDIANRAATMQDPFGGERAFYAGKLRELMSNPSSITSMPGYKAGEQAVTRKLASQGYLGSGNMLTSLAEYGGSFFDKEASRLASLAGANIGPSGGGALVTGSQNAFNAASQALASLGYTAREISRILQG